MSMSARFVEISPLELKAIVRDPDSAERFFTPSVPAGAGFAALLERPGMAERMQAMLDAYLQSASPDVVRTLGGKNADLQTLLRERLGGRAPGGSGGARAGNGTTDAPQRKTIDLEKAWHGIHYVLYGSGDLMQAAPDSAVLGGVEVGDDMGYGPPRYHDAVAVKRIAAELATIDFEQSLVERFDPAAMTALELYPNGWDADDRAWLAERATWLRDFYAGAAERGACVLTALV